MSATKPIRQSAKEEPVAVAGVVRAIVYSLLGTRGLDPGILAAIVVAAEAVSSWFVRRHVWSHPSHQRSTGEQPPTPPASMARRRRRRPRKDELATAA
jgi:hypothetical protein